MCVDVCVLSTPCLSLSFDSLVLAFQHDIYSNKRLMKEKKRTKLLCVKKHLITINIVVMKSCLFSTDLKKVYKSWSRTINGTSFSLSFLFFFFSCVYWIFLREKKEIKQKKKHLIKIILEFSFDCFSSFVTGSCT